MAGFFEAKEEHYPCKTDEHAAAPADHPGSTRLLMLEEKGQGAKSNTI